MKRILSVTHNTWFSCPCFICILIGSATKKILTSQRDKTANTMDLSALVVVSGSIRYVTQIRVCKLEIQPFRFSHSTSSGRFSRLLLTKNRQRRLSVYMQTVASIRRKRRACNNPGQSPSVHRQEALRLDCARKLNRTCQSGRRKTERKRLEFDGKPEGESWKQKPKLTCSVLSYQRLPEFECEPLPCNICRWSSFMRLSV